MEFVFLIKKKTNLSSCFSLYSTRSVCFVKGLHTRRCHPVVPLHLLPHLQAQTHTHGQNKERKIKDWSCETVIQLCYQPVRDHLWQHAKWVLVSPMARWSTTDKAEPRAPAFWFTLLLNHSLFPALLSAMGSIGRGWTGVCVCVNVILGKKVRKCCSMPVAHFLRLKLRF